MNWLRARLPGRAGLLWCAAAVLLGGVVVEPLWDPDLWWHLAVGQWIGLHGAVPRADPFALGAAARPWLAHEWMFEVFLFGAQRLGGERLLVLVPAFAAAATAGFALRRAFARGQPAVVAAPVVLLALLPTQDFWTQRPQLFTFLLLSWLLLDLQRYADGQARVPWKWVALVALWANLHGAFVVALLAIGAQLAGALVEARARARGLGGLLVACSHAGLLNPRGASLYAHAWRYSSSDWHGVAIIDWQPPDFADPRRVFFLAVVGAAFVLAALSRKARLGDLLLVGGFGAMALRWQRNIPFALIAAAPLCAVWLGEAWKKWRRAAPVTVAAPPGSVGWARGGIHLLVLGVIAAGALLVRWPCRGGACEQPGAFPQEAVKFLAAHEDEGPSPHLLNHFDWGGYLLWRRPGSAVYIDGRAPELDVEKLHRYGRIHRLDPGWRELLREEGVDEVLYPRDSALARALEALGWHTRFADDTAVLLSRRGAPGR